MRPAESFVSQPIRSLQAMLRVLAELDESYVRIIPDGIYGAQTMASVAKFQRLHGLPMTGVTDQATWDAIVAAYIPALVQIDAAEPVQIILNPGEVLVRGQSSPYLYIVQALLTVLAQVYGSIGTPSQSGVLDAQTADSISSFQALCGLPMTGNLDKLTWKHLALQFTLGANMAAENARASQKR